MIAFVTSGVESSHNALQGHVNRGFRQLLGLRPKQEMRHISSIRHEYKCILHEQHLRGHEARESLTLLHAVQGQVE